MQPKAKFYATMGELQAIATVLFYVIMMQENKFTDDERTSDALVLADSSIRRAMHECLREHSQTVRVNLEHRRFLLLKVVCAWYKDTTHYARTIDYMKNYPSSTKPDPDAALAALDAILVR